MMSRLKPHIIAAVLIASIPGLSMAAEPVPPELQSVSVSEQLGEHVNFGLVFQNHNGERVQLGDFFEDGRPVLLTLNYYECPQLCTRQLNGLIEGLRLLELEDTDFRLVTVSIDPFESVELADEKRRAYLSQIDRDLDWSFLVGEAPSIHALAAEVGFGYQYNAEQDQYAHAAVIFFLSPDGTLVRYLYGLDYSARDLRLALIDASEGRIELSLGEQVLLTCFHWVDGSYSMFAWGIMRIVGTTAAVIFGFVLAMLWRRERRRSREAVA